MSRRTIFHRLRCFAETVLTAFTIVFVSVFSGTAAPLPAIRDSDFKGAGLCQFAVHGFVMSPQTEKAINESVQKLLDRHRAAFGFPTRAGFRVRMRVFGDYQDYTNATFSLYWTNAADRRALQGRPFNIAGFYTSQTREIVTWRQQMPGFLGTTLLHEAGHAIMDAHFANVPAWLMEGSADFFAFALHPPGELQQRMLHQRWMRLNEWRRDGSLLALENLLNATAVDFRQLDPEKAYTTSWSLFQMLMSNERGRQAMLVMLQERQSPDGDDLDGAKQLERLYAGGLKRLEASWHAWIAAGAGVTNQPPARAGSER